MSDTAKALDVLLVDDDEDVCETLRVALLLNDLKVEAVHRGDVALGVVLSRKPALVICDIKMPGLNGFELLRAVRDSGGDVADTPFLILSGLTGSEFLAAGYRIGADDYLTKPVDINVLRYKVRAILARIERSRADSESAPVELPEPLKKLFKEVVSRRTNSSAGHIKLFSMDELEGEVGDAWPRVRSKAASIAESVIRRTLGPHDAYSRYDDDGFVITFGRTDPEAASFLLNQIVERIREKLLGDAAFKPVSFDSVSAPLSRVIDQQGALKGRGLEDAFARASEAQHAEAEPLPWFERQLSISFSPTWDRTTEAVDFNMVQRVRRTKYGNFTGNAIQHGGIEDPDALNVDIRIAALVREAMERQVGHVSRLATVVIPLNFRSVISPEFHRVLDALGFELGADNNIAIELVNVPDYRTELIMIQAAQIAARLGKLTIFRIDPHDRHAASLKRVGMRLLSMSLNDLDEAADDRTVLQRIDDFTASCRDKGFDPVIHDVLTHDQVVAVLRNKVRLFSGIVVGPMKQSPVESNPMDTKRLLGY